MIEMKVPKFMASWSRKWQWTFTVGAAFFLLVIVMPAVDRALLLIPTFRPCAGYIDAIEIPALCARQRQIGFLVIIILAMPLFLILHALAYPKENSRKPVEKFHSFEPGLSSEAVLPSVYGICSGSIEAVPGSGLQLSISGEVFDTVANGLFACRLVEAGEQVHGIYRSVPIIKNWRLLLAVYVPRTKRTLGVGSGLQFGSAMMMALVAIWSLSLASFAMRLITIFAVIYLVLDVAYLVLVVRSKKHLSMQIGGDSRPA